MTRLLGVLALLCVLVLAMAFAALNGGHRVTVDLWIVTFYRVPVAFVAFGGLFVGMFGMLLTGIHTDLKVRRILKGRLEDEAREERERIDRNQQDLFQEEQE